MSDTPTLASLLQKLVAGSVSTRQAVHAYLRANPADAAAAEPFIRDELTSPFPRDRLNAAESLLAVYGDETIAANAISFVLRQGDSAAKDCEPVLRQLSPPVAGPLLVDFALHAPAAFQSLSPGFHRWAGATGALAGKHATDIWLSLLAHAGATTESALFMGLADAACRVNYDLTALVPGVEARVLLESSGYAAGAALWRLTYRANWIWISSIQPKSSRFDDDPELLVLLIEVLSEQLGRRPALTKLTRELLLRLARDSDAAFAPVAERLASLGARGWAVLLPILGQTDAPASARTFVFQEAARNAAVLPLVHHHAHNTLLEGSQAHDTAKRDLLKAACAVLAGLGTHAISAIPDMLSVMIHQPEVAHAIAPHLLPLVQLSPTSVGTVGRALNRLRCSPHFTPQYYLPEAFAALAGVYARLDHDGIVQMIADTSYDARTGEALLELPQWKHANADARERHAKLIAELLLSPRAEIRSRSAEALRYYTAESHTVWPTLVAVLAGNDEKTALSVLPLFRDLAPVADKVTPELVLLFREPNVAYAARAVIGLWRLNRLPVIASELGELVLASADANGRGWVILRAIAQRAMQTHGLLAALAELFADTSGAIVTHVHTLLYPEIPAEEAAIQAHVPLRGGDPATAIVNWDGIYDHVCTHEQFGLLFLALMCEFGTQNVTSQKIRLIKHQRSLTQTNLADSKSIVERAMEQLALGASRSEKRACVRAYLAATVGIPKAIVDLLEHSNGWYRWAGLVLLDAWGAPERVGSLIQDRLQDRSELVRAQAIRMNHG